MKTIDVSIIIVNYNTLSLTRECIDSIFYFTKRIAFEVILVDNNSDDGSKEFFQQDKRITYIYEKENHGFGIANNIGAKVAVGKYLFFLNSDTILFEDSIQYLFSFLEDKKDAVICGGNLVSKEKLPTSSFERFFPSISYAINELLVKIPGKILYGKNTSFNYSKKPLKVAYVSGADLMIKKSDFDMLNGFDENFFMYFEETDLCKRASKFGSIYSVPSASIIHLGGQSSKDSPKLPSEKKLRIQSQSAKYFFSKHYGKIYVKIYNLIKMLSAYTRVLEFFVIGDKDKADMWRSVIRLNR